MGMADKMKEKALPGTSVVRSSSNSMQESIDELYDTTKKKAETQLKRLQSLGADFGEEMLPVLEKIIDKADEFEFNKANEFIALQNRREDIASTETFKGYKSVESPYVKKLVR